MSERRGFFGFLKGLKKDPATPLAQTTLADTNIDSYTMTSPNELNPIITNEIADYATSMLTTILHAAQFSVTVSISKQVPDKLYLDIASATDTGRIIGKEGATLNALQVLIRAFVFQKFNVQAKLFVDSENYHKKRTHLLRSSALKSANTVVENGSAIELRPMNAQERRVLHLLFKNNPSIQVSSIGEGRNRRILLEPSSPNG